MKRLAALALAAALAGGCSTLPQREAFLNSLVGKPVTDLVGQLGVPNRTFDTEGRRYLAYDERRVDVFPGGPYLGGPYIARGFGYLGYDGYTFAPDVVTWNCETTFEVVNARVQSWSLRGNACGSFGPRPGIQTYPGPTFQLGSAQSGKPS